MAANQTHPRRRQIKDNIRPLELKDKGALKWLSETAFQDKKAKHPNVPDHALNKPKYSDKTANGLQKCIIDCIMLIGGQAERISSEGRVIDNRHTVTDIMGQRRTLGDVKRIPTSGRKGTADISATILGRSVKVEVKIGRDRQSEHQREYQKEVEASGGIYLIISSFQQFFDWYQDFLEQVYMDSPAGFDPPKPFTTSNTQFEVVYKEFFREPQTMKQVSVATGIDRANLCWYCRELRKHDRIKPLRKTKCPITRHEAKVWTTDPALFPQNPQLSLFATK